MSEYPYAHVSSKLKDFLERIPSTGVPEKVTYNELAARGFKSTNDRTILGVLKHLNLVDSEGVPTEHWNSYRNRSTNKALLVTLIRSAYSELFVLYPEAQEQTDEQIRNFIASKTKVGEDSIQRIVTTFRTLCGMADFSVPEAQNGDRVQESELRRQNIPDEIGVRARARGSTEKMTPPVQPALAPFHLHVHIHLSETDNVQAAEAQIKMLTRYIPGLKTEDEA